MKLLLLFIVGVLIVLTTRQPAHFIELKEKYYEFIKVLPDRFAKLRTPSIITGTYNRGEFGWNINKGYEITVCLDEDVNAMFHVLLHELAHCVAEDYGHSADFWKIFRDLRQVAVDGGFYTMMKVSEPYCGKKIKD